MSYLFIAYSIIWIVLFFYISGLLIRQKRLFSEIENLRQLIKEKDI